MPRPGGDSALNVLVYVIQNSDHVAFEHTLGKERESSNVEKGSDVKMHINSEMVTNRTDLVQTAHHLSPLTPLLKCSE